MNYSIICTNFFLFFEYTFFKIEQGQIIIKDAFVLLNA